MGGANNPLVANLERILIVTLPLNLNADGHPLALAHADPCVEDPHFLTQSTRRIP
jgi:hypothetical protein